MTFRNLLTSTAISAGLLTFAGAGYAQTTISADQTTPVVTSTDGDVTINAGVTVGPASGTGVTVDSNNDVTNSGTISIENADNSTGVELVGGNSGDLNVTGNIQVQEDYSATDTDDDNIVDGPFAQGTGRTGILISGASPFAGNVTLDSSSGLSVEGNNSYGVRIQNAAGLIGDLTLAGVMSIIGDNSRLISVEGDLTGNLVNSGVLSSRGDGVSAIVTEGNVTGQINNSGTISNSGYRFTDRPALAGRNLLGAEDLLQAGSAIQINGNVANGLFLEQVETTTVDADGNSTTSITGRSSISQLGGAPAVLIDGQGTPIALGIVASITNPADPDYDASEQYAFVNQGFLSASGVYDDINATSFEVRDATLTNGISNTGTLQATAFRSGDDGTADAAGATGVARVIVLGSGAIANEINNSGIILAQVNEATDEIFADRSNIVPPRFVEAVAIDVEAGGSLSNLVNTGNISAILTARNGEAVAVRDTTGSLTFIENSGNIAALATSSDAQNLVPINFNLIALDLSANTTGVTINQIVPVDTDPTDAITPADPTIIGEILLGSGADTLDVQAGVVTGDVAFGGGADTFNLSGGSAYIGAMSDSDGALTIDVSGGSTLAQTAAAPINVTSASFDATSVFRPTLDGATGLASTLNATGNINFASGATIFPILQNVISSSGATFRVLDAGGTLNLGGTPASLNGLTSPFMYDITYALDPMDPNALLITLDLRSTSALGLDTVQTSSFASAFQAMQNNTDLANAFVNITDGTEFNNSLSQLLPEFAAAGRQFVFANVDGAVGAVGSHLDNARKSQEKPGGIWIQEFAYFADRDLAELSEQYRGHGFGVTGGIDTAFGPFHTVGLNVGFASTEIEDVVGVDEPLDVVTFQAGAYAGLSLGDLGIEFYGGGGYNDFEATRNVQVGTFSDSAEGDWSGTHYNASVRGGYDIDLSDKFWMRPAFSFDYLSLTENAYTESGALGVALDVDERTSELGGASAMLNVGANFNGRRTWLRPSIRVGYRNDFINDGVITNYGFSGLSNRATLIGSEFPDSGVLLGFSVAAGSNYSSFGLDFDSDIRDGFIRHTGRIVLRLIF